MIDKNLMGRLGMMLFLAKEKQMELAFTDEAQNELLDKLIEKRLDYYVNYGIFDILTHDEMEADEADGMRDCLIKAGLFFSWVNDEENDSWHYFLKRG
jgi:hypothetical protein